MGSAPEPERTLPSLPPASGRGVAFGDVVNDDGCIDVLLSNVNGLKIFDQTEACENPSVRKRKRPARAHDYGRSCREN
jgi:hypothetical protein